MLLKQVPAGKMSPTIAFRAGNLEPTDGCFKSAYLYGCLLSNSPGAVRLDKLLMEFINVNYYSIFGD